MNRSAITASTAVMILTFTLGGCGKPTSEAQITVTEADDSYQISLTDLDCQDFSTIRSISSSEPHEFSHWPQLNVKVGGKAKDVLSVAINDDRWFVMVGELEQPDGQIVFEDVTGVILAETTQDGQVDYVPTGLEAQATGYVTCDQDS